MNTEPTTTPTAPSPRPPRSLGRRLWAFTWRVAAVVILLLIATEIVLRVMGYGSREMYASSLDMLWEPLPNQQVGNKYTNLPVTFDQYALRKVPGADTGTQDRITVLWLGDSVTFGYALSDEEAPPAVLQARLERDQPGRWRVLNGGVSGYSLSLVRQRFHKLLERGVKPDLILLSFCFNEWAGWPGDHFSEERRAEIVQRVQIKNKIRSIALYNFLTETVAGNWYYKLRNRIYAGPRQKVVNPKALAQADEAWLHVYRQRVRLCLDEFRQRGIPVIAVLWQDKTLSPGPFRATFVEEIQAAKVPLIDLREVLEGKDTTGMFLEFEHPLAPAVEMMVNECIAPRFEEEAARLLRLPSLTTSASP